MPSNKEHHRQSESSYYEKIQVDLASRDQVVVIKEDYEKTQSRKSSSVESEQVVSNQNQEVRVGQPNTELKTNKLKRHKQKRRRSKSTGVVSDFVHLSCNHFEDDPEFNEKIKQVEFAIDHNILPQRIYEGSSGSYFAKNTNMVINLHMHLYYSYNYLFNLPSSHLISSHLMHVC